MTQVRSLAKLVLFAEREHWSVTTEVSENNSIIYNRSCETDIWLPFEVGLLSGPVWLLSFEIKVLLYNLPG